MICVDLSPSYDGLICEMALEVQLLQTNDNAAKRGGLKNGIIHICEILQWHSIKATIQYVRKV